MNYYYMTKDGDFLDTSRQTNDPKYIQINELEYYVSRLLVRGYTRTQIEEATEKVFMILQSKTERE